MDNRVVNQQMQSSILKQKTMAKIKKRKRLMKVPYMQVAFVKLHFHNTKSTAKKEEDSLMTELVIEWSKEVEKLLKSSIAPNGSDSDGKSDDDNLSNSSHSISHKVNTKYHGDKMRNFSLDKPAWKMDGIKERLMKIKEKRQNEI